MAENEGFYDWKALKKLVPVERMTIWRWEGEGRFPLRVRLGRRRIAWRRAEVDKWMAERPIVRTGGAVHKDFDPTRNYDWHPRRKSPTENGYQDAYRDGSYGGGYLMAHEYQQGSWPYH